MRPVLKATFAMAAAALAIVLALGPGMEGALRADEAGTASPQGASAGGFESVLMRHDFRVMAPDTRVVVVPGDAGPLHVRAWLGGDVATLCSGPLPSAVRVEVLAPSGEVYAELAPSTGNFAGTVVGSTTCGRFEQHHVHLPPGEWTVRFEGRGSYLGLVELLPA